MQHIGELLSICLYCTFLSDLALVLVFDLEKYCCFPLELFYITVLHYGLNGTAVRTIMGLINAKEVFLGFQTWSLRDSTCYLTASTLTHTHSLCQLIAFQHVTIWRLCSLTEHFAAALAALHISHCTTCTQTPLWVAVCIHTEGFKWDFSCTKE